MPNYSRYPDPLFSPCEACDWGAVSTGLFDEKCQGGFIFELDVPGDDFELVLPLEIGFFSYDFTIEWKRVNATDISQNTLESGSVTTNFKRDFGPNYDSTVTDTTTNDNPPVSLMLDK